MKKTLVVSFLILMATIANANVFFSFSFGRPCPVVETQVIETVDVPTTVVIDPVYTYYPVYRYYYPSYRPYYPVYRPYYHGPVYHPVYHGPVYHPVYHGPVYHGPINHGPAHGPVYHGPTNHGGHRR